MKVRMMTTACGPDGSYIRGREYDVPDELAQEWMKRTPVPYCQPVDERQRRQLQAATLDNAGKRNRA